MDTISNNSSQIASVRTVTSLNYIKKTYNLPGEDRTNFENHISADDKNSIISDKSGVSSEPASYNFQYQNNVPVSVLTTTTQTFNETAKPFVNKESSPVTNDSEFSDYFVEDSSGKSQKTGLGYYIIDKRFNAPAGGKSAKKLPNPMRDRLNKAYNLNFGIEPGTIVNVTCF